MSSGPGRGRYRMTNAFTGPSQGSTLDGMASTDTVRATTSPADIGLLILRIGVGVPMIHAGLVKVMDFGATVGFMESAGWRLPLLAALMVTVAEAAGGIGLVLGLLTPLAACAVAGAMICAWAVNVSQGAVWSEPFNVPFLLFIGATTLLFAGAGGYSVDARVLGRLRWSARIAVGLLVFAVAVAVLTWILLNGTNPIHFSSPA